MKSKLLITVIIFISLPLVVFAQNSETEKSVAVNNLIIEAFKQPTTEQICAVLETKIPHLQTVAERKAGFKFLANYEESIGFYTNAATHFSAASLLATSEEAQNLKLNAARTYLLAGDIDIAFELIKAIKANASSKSVLLKANVYSCLAGSSYSTDVTLKNIRSLVVSSDYVYYHPMLLFALWWIDEDTTAKNTLIKRYPNSPEAAVIKGNATLTPSAFWYLMPRSDNQIANTVKSTEYEVVNKNSETIKKAELFQIGFYKNKTYAENQRNELKAKGFDAYINSETRKTGTYYIVLVRENSSGTVLATLKDAGYESSPVF